MEQQLRDEIEEWKAAAIVLEDEKKIWQTQQEAMTENWKEQIRATESMVKRFLLALNSTISSSGGSSTVPSDPTHLDLALSQLEKIVGAFHEYTDMQLEYTMAKLLFDLGRELPDKIKQIHKSDRLEKHRKYSSSGTLSGRSTLGADSAENYAPQDQPEPVRHVINVLRYEIDRKDSIIQDLRTQLLQSNPQSSIQYLMERNQKLEQENRKLTNQLTDLKRFSSMSPSSPVPQFSRKNSNEADTLYTGSTHTKATESSDDGFSTGIVLPSYVPNISIRPNTPGSAPSNLHPRHEELQGQLEHISFKLQESSRRLQIAEKQVHVLKAESSEQLSRAHGPKTIPRPHYLEESRIRRGFS